VFTALPTRANLLLQGTKLAFASGSIRKQHSTLKYSGVVDLLPKKTMTIKKPKLLFITPDAIREYRRKHDFNQFQFWSRVGVTQSGGSRYESGRNMPTSVQLLLQIAYGTPKQAAEMVAWLQAREV